MNKDKFCDEMRDKLTKLQQALDQETIANLWEMVGDLIDFVEFYEYE